MPALAPEMALVVCCARMEPDPIMVGRARALARNGLDWDRVVREAVAHSTVPLLYRSVSRFCADLVPQPTMADLEEHFQGNAEGVRMLARRMVDLVEELAGVGIPAIPIKGPVLAASAYGDLAMRQWGDLDILVPPRAYRRASDLLADMGFRQVDRHGWQATFLDPAQRIVVDLHQALAEPRFPVRLGFDELWARRRSVAVEGTTVANLSPEDTLLLLCMQLAKDGWDRRAQLSKVADITQVQAAWPALDKDELAERAARLGARRIVHLGMLVARDVLGAPSPPAGIVAPREAKLVFELAERVKDDLLGYPELEGTRWRRQHRFHFRARERARDKLFPYIYLPYHWRAHVRPVVTPKQSDRSVVSLPERLSSLYYVIRPLRVLRDLVLRRPAETSSGVRRNPGVAFQVVDGRVVFVDDSGGDLVTLNQLGSLVWQSLDECGEPSALTDRLLPELGQVDRHELERDVTVFLEELREIGLVLDEPGSGDQ